MKAVALALLITAVLIGIPFLAAVRHERRAPMPRSRRRRQYLHRCHVSGVQRAYAPTGKMRLGPLTVDRLTETTVPRVAVPEGAIDALAKHHLSARIYAN